MPFDRRRCAFPFKGSKKSPSKPRKILKNSKIFGHFQKVAYLCSPNEGIRGVAQLASASGLGPEGPVFESQYPDKGRGDDDESPPFLIAETLRDWAIIS